MKIKACTYNVMRLGKSPKDLLRLAKVIKKYDLIGIIEVVSTQGLMDLWSLMGKDYDFQISAYPVGLGADKEYYGYIYKKSKLKPVKYMGFYSDKNPEDYTREPYGLQFMTTNGNIFNYVLLHIADVMSGTRKKEVSLLPKVFEFFEDLTGNEYRTILAGDFGETRVLHLNMKALLPHQSDLMDNLIISNKAPFKVKHTGIDIWTRDIKTRITVSNHYPTKFTLLF
jgi:hypothetical protein